MSSYYRYDQRGTITGAGTGALRPSLRTGETEVEITDELANAMQGIRLQEYRQQGAKLMRDKEAIVVEKPASPVTLEALAAKVRQLELKPQSRGA